MDASIVAFAMASAVEHFEKERNEAEKFWELAAKLLAKRLKKSWIAYLQEHGIAEVEEDFIERYSQFVKGARRSEDAFLQWVQEQVEANEPLITYLKVR